MADGPEDAFRQAIADAGTYRYEGMGNASVDAREAVMVCAAALQQVGWMAPECYSWQPFFTRHEPESKACRAHGHPWLPLFVVPANAASRASTTTEGDGS